MKEILKNIYLFLRGVVLLPLLCMRRIKVFSGKDVEAVLFLRHDRIGDMVVSTPVFKAFKKKYPDIKVFVLASKANKAIIENDPFVDEIIVYEGLWQFIKVVKLRKIDLCVDLFYTYEFKTAFMAWLTFAQYRIGFAKAGREIFFNLKSPGINLRKPMTGCLFELVKSLGVDEENILPELYLTKTENAWADSFLLSRGMTSQDFKIAVHPGGFYPSQRWQKENFVKTMQYALDKYRAKILVFGSLDEMHIADFIKKEFPSGGVEVVCGMALRQVAALLNACRLFVGNNSGILHMASALGLSTVSTMGPTDAVLWQPQGTGFHIVLNKALQCLACGRRQCLAHDCMRMITVKDMTEAIDIQMQRVSR